MFLTAVWIGDGCFKDPGATECVGVAACACYEDGRCNGDLLCDEEQICRRADCRPGEDKCPCSGGLCLGDLVCDGQSCRQPGEVDGGNPGDGADGADGGRVDDPDDDDDDDDVTTGSMEGGDDDDDDDMGPTGPGETEGPPTTGPTDEGAVEEGPATTDDPMMCMPQDWPPSHCGWVETNMWWGCGGGGQCGADDAPILCPTGFDASSVCSEVGVDPLMGCCMPDGSEAYCQGTGSTATINPCGDPSAMNG